MIRLRASLLLLVGSACGGEVAVDGPEPDAGSKRNDPLSCPSGSEVETLFTSGGTTRIADFIGDGVSVAMATSPIDDLTASEVSIRPVARANVSPKIDGEVGFVGGARDRIFFGEPYKMVSLPWDGSDDIMTSSVMSLPLFVTSHPERDDAFFVDTAPGSGVQSIWSVHSGQAPQLAIGPMPEEFVMSLAASPSGVIALIADTRPDRTAYKLVRPASNGGGDIYEVLAHLPELGGNAVVSNAVMDGNAGIVAVYDRVPDIASRRIVVSRYEGANMAAGEGTILGTIPISTPPNELYDIQIDLDEAWVYVAYAADGPAQCGGSICTHSFDVVRFKKDGSSSNDTAPAVLKTFQGPRDTRPFDVDACYFVWHDTASGALNRQPKASL